MLRFSRSPGCRSSRRKRLKTPHPAGCEGSNLSPGVNSHTWADCVESAERQLQLENETYHLFDPCEWPNRTNRP